MTGAAAFLVKIMDDARLKKLNRMQK